MLAGTIGVLTLVVLYAVFFLVPPAEGLGNYVRIAFFHIPTAWVAVVAFFGAAYWGARYLKTRELRYDAKSARSAILGLIFTLMATVSGAVTRMRAQPRAARSNMSAAPRILPGCSTVSPSCSSSPR